MHTIEELIRLLDLRPHPEGGYFRETYRSPGTIPTGALPQEYTSPRSFSTAIYFLLTSDNFSAFHRIHQEEIWHFYEGRTISLHIISPKGDYTHSHVGPNINVGERPQVIVPGGHWFAAEIAEPDSYALVGCTVAPGFDFDDFELADRSELMESFPEHRELILRLTRSNRSV